MALTVPMDALRNMQVSFRVGLPDGTFTFDMVPLDTMDRAGLSSDVGMKLNLRAIPDATGVTLLLSMSGTGVGDAPYGNLDYVVVDPSQLHPLDEVKSTPSFMGLGNSPAPPENNYTQSEETSELLAMGYLTPDDLLAPNMSSHTCHGDSNFNNSFYDAYNAGYIPESFFDRHRGNSLEAAHSGYASSSSSSSEKEVFGDDFVRISYSPAPDSDVSTPSTSSDSQPSYFPSPRSRSKLRCPEPSCTRSFSYKSTLSKHLATHEPKSQKEFLCTLGCAMRFSRKHDRLRHEVSQHGRVCEWACNVCLGFFSSETTLRKHKCKIVGGARWMNQT
ncbi:hypothetical protein K438DRAFT_1666455 [Mycena galopus ATCC 62051]|nr:hypothetical protein K438DRAFT_1666455 [Mycena galopus ATCC 62051]